MLVSLYNRLLLALFYRRRMNRVFPDCYTCVEAHVCAGCIGEITEDMWRSHQLARAYGPMPECGAGYWSPNWSVDK
jgi:hypothetical protein